MIGIESLILVFPCNTISDCMAYIFGECIAHFETAAVLTVSGSAVYVSVSVSPAILDKNGKLLLEKIVSIIGVPPCATSPENNGVTGCLIMDTKSIGILTTFGFVVIVM